MSDVIDITCALTKTNASYPYLEVLVVGVEAVCGAVERLREALVRLVSRQLVERPLRLCLLRTHVVRVRKAQSVAST